MQGLFTLMWAALIVVATSSTATADDDRPIKVGTQITKRAFGTDSVGEKVDEYTLTNGNGMSAHILTFGATLRELYVPDKDGKKENIVLGFDNIEQYEQAKGRPYYGATVGRYANRIAGAKFSLDKKTYVLAANNGRNCLHGGLRGFDMHNWHAQVLPQQNGAVAVKFDYMSKDMEEGFPGNLRVEVIYSLSADDTLKIDYSATTDKTTILNLTNHSYFNLDGAGNGDILQQKIKIYADAYLPVDAELIPLGKASPVKGTPFDFTSSKEIGRDNDSVKGGYDHNWILRGKVGGLKEAVIASSDRSKRVLTMSTTEPGVQMYISQGQDGTLKGNGGTYQKYCGFALEAQHYPDSPHHLDYPSVVLKPGAVYKQTTAYKFANSR